MAAGAIDDGGGGVWDVTEWCRWCVSWAVTVVRGPSPTPVVFQTKGGLRGSVMVPIVRELP